MYFDNYKFTTIQTRTDQNVPKYNVFQLIVI